MPGSTARPEGRSPGARVAGNGGDQKTIVTSLEQVVVPASHTW